MKQFRKKFLRNTLSLALVIVLITGMLPCMAERANAATRYDVVFDANGGKNAVTGQTSWTIGYDSGTSLNLSASVFKRDGYELTGFKVGTKTYPLGTPIKVTSPMTIVAQWKQPSFTIKYYPVPGNYNVYMTQEATLSGYVTLKNNTTGVTKSGYTFIGWNTKITTAALYEPTAKVKSSSLCKTANTTVTLYGVWKCNHSTTKTETTKPTCVSDGVERKICKQCNKVLSTKKLKATGHKWQVYSHGNETEHAVICSVCGEYSTQKHTFKLTQVVEGRHYYVCTADGCSESKYAEYCRECVPSNTWIYFIDTHTYSSQGQNFLLRYGSCPTCGTNLIEYGNTGFVGTSDMGKVIECVFKGIISLAGLTIAVFSIQVGSITIVVRLNTVFSLAQSGTTIYNQAKAYRSDKRLAQKIKESDVEALAHLEYLKDSEALDIAKIYFAPPFPRNMKTIYDYSELKSGLKHN